MSSSEDYLDSLLKAAMEGNSDSHLSNDEIAAETDQLNDKQHNEEIKSVDENQGFEDLMDLVNEDPNKTLSPDEIEAMFARAQSVSEQNTDIVNDSIRDEAKENTLQKMQEQPKQNIDIDNLAVSEDPNKVLSPDEIAAMFAMAQSSETTEETIEASEEGTTETLDMEAIAKQTESSAMEETESPIIEASIQPSESNIDIEESNLENTEDTEDTDKSEDLEIKEEMEIDLDDPEALDILLGIKEKPASTEDEGKSKEQTDDSTDTNQRDQIEESDSNTDNRSTTTSTEELDLESLLNDLGEDDPELKEIGELLKKSDQHELVDDDILSLLEENKDEKAVKSSGLEENDSLNKSDMNSSDAISDDSNEIEVKDGKKKKKKKKIPFFNRKKKQNIEEQSEEAETEKEDNQKTVSDKNSQNKDLDVDMENLEDQEDSVDDFINSFASGELEDDSSLNIPENKRSTKVGKTSKEKKDKDLSNETVIENKKTSGFFSKIFNALTEEVEEEEEESKPKKVKKGKKGKKSSVTDANDNEGILEELDSEEDNKKKKKSKKKDKKNDKKPKKVKIVKEKKPKDIKEDNKKLPSKMVIRIFILCFSLMALILITVNILPNIWGVVDARNAFYKQDYETTFEEMSGKKLSKSDERLFHKSKIILQLQHKFDAYSKYKEMNLPVEALDSLLSGYALWGKMNSEIAEYEAVSETDVVKNQIVTELQNGYQITEEDAITINALDDYDYTLKLEEITGHLSRKNSKFKEEVNSNINPDAEKVEESSEQSGDNIDNGDIKPNDNDAQNEDINQENTIQNGKAEDVLPEEGIE